MQALNWRQALDRDPKSWVCNIVWGGNQLALESFTTPGLEGYLLSLPCADSRAGGDIYHVTVCGHGVFSKFLLVDVAGHGDSAAHISSRLQQPLAHLMSELDNGAILAELNNRILCDETNGNFATAAAATYNHWDRSLNYAYAGHPYMLIRRNGGWQHLPECCAGPPIGILGDISYFQNEIPLNGEDWLFLFSDAVFEIKRTDGTRLGFEGLVDLLNTIEAEAIGPFYQELVDVLVGVNGGDIFEDDLTLILLKQQQIEESLSARALSSGRKLMMRWMKRKEPRCTTALPELPTAARV